MEVNHEAAVLSKAAYDYFRDGLEAAQAELVEYGLDGYHFDAALSDDYSVVIERPDRTAVISYRGTDALEDVVPDIQILLGRHSPFAHRLTALRSGTHITDRFEAADRKYQHAAEKYTPERIAYLTGHSLGGTQAIATARRRGLVSHAFNPGSSPFVEMIHAGVCSLADCDERPQSIYTTGTDPISFGSYLFDPATDNVVTVMPKHGGDWFSHSLSHFLPSRASRPEPTWLQPVHAVTGERRPFCEAFPAYCPPRV